MMHNYLRGSPHWGVHRELCKIEKIMVPVGKENPEEGKKLEIAVWIAKPKRLAASLESVPAMVYAHGGG